MRGDNDMCKMKQLEELTEEGFFKATPLHTPGYHEKVPGTSVGAVTRKGSRITLTGFFSGKSGIHGGKIQYFDQTKGRFLYLSKNSITVVGTKKPKARQKKRPRGRGFKPGCTPWNALRGSGANAKRAN